MKKRIEGKIHRLGSNITVDQIYPEKYLDLTDASEVARHVFEGYDAGLPAEIQSGNIIVAGRNFGCGISHESYGSVGQAVMSLVSAGVACVVASSFARPFYRNAINHGFPLVECREAHEKLADGETVALDFEKGEIAYRKGVLAFAVYPELIARILSAGGLLPYTRRSLGK